ncbi:UNVERIFIED_CONTAM: hypothetical protein ABIC26_002613 [Paenibacillus sp. PvR008]
MLFIKKKKLLQQIDDMIEDCEYYKERVFYSDSNDHKQKREAFLAKQSELLDLKYWVIYKDNIRPLRSRKKHTF